MTGFGDMKKQAQDPSAGQTAEELQQQIFEAAVFYIFPDSPSTRLARACGNVAQRTAQKWISGQITPPQDVREYVFTQARTIEQAKFGEVLARIMAEAGDGVDNEVVAAHLSKFYEELTGLKIR